jgi:membrane-associated phospholipid phosphatase
MRFKRFYSGEWLTLAYILSTVFYMAFFLPKVHNMALLFGVRIAVVAGIGLLALISNTKESSFLLTIRQLLPFLLLGYWYSETFYFSTFYLTDKDAFFCHLDERLFGCQPSLIFSATFPQAWFSELMYFGYFSHYLFIFGVPLWFLFKHPVYFDRIVFVTLCSFFLYYGVFDILPVGGPQFYFKGAAAEVPSGYFFSDLVRLIQRIGEKPTGAFPSAHVGMTVIALLFTFLRTRRFFWIILPLGIILMFSTVYIKAHYLVDVFGGIFSAILFYAVSNRLFDLLSEKQRFVPEMETSGSENRRD